MGKVYGHEALEGIKADVPKSGSPLKFLWGVGEERRVEIEEKRSCRVCCVDRSVTRFMGLKKGGF
jgi:hypothetical protein